MAIARTHLAGALQENQSEFKKPALISRAGGLAKQSSKAGVGVLRCVGESEVGCLWKMVEQREIAIHQRSRSLVSQAWTGSRTIANRVGRRAFSFPYSFHTITFTFIGSFPSPPSPLHAAPAT